MVLPKIAADKLDGEKDKQEHTTPSRAYWMNFKLDANSFAQIIKRKMAFFGHACRNNKCNLVKTCILGMMPG